MATEGLGDPFNTGSSFPICVSCNSAITDQSYLIKTVCGHFFHKACFHRCMKSSPNCPNCKNKLVVSNPIIPSTPVNNPISLPPAMGTRLQTQRAIIFDANRSTGQGSSPQVGPSQAPQQINLSASSESPHDQLEQIRSIVVSTVSAQQAEIATNLSRTLTSLIEKNIEEGFRRLKMNTIQTNSGPMPPSEPPIATSNGPMRTLPDVEQQTLEQLLGLPSNTNMRNASANTNMNISGHEALSTSGVSFRPDRIGHIISNWKIKFSGDVRGMSVDNFIYRVRALTSQTLSGNFDILCDHISILFDAKANDWFWRYHQTVPQIKWPELCAALRKQYKDSRTDVDYREMIRDRKQRVGETFDSFYEAIVDIADRLCEPLSEKVLVEILRRNLLNEIQHEILNIKIETVSDLRDICRRREFFMQDIGRKQSFQKLSNRKYLSEFDSEDLEALPNEDLSAIALICWNCRQSGHRYQDCLQERRIFCYGCGAVNIYKPQCPDCNSPKNLRSGAQKSALKPTHSTNNFSDHSKTTIQSNSDSHDYYPDITCTLPETESNLPLNTHNLCTIPISQTKFIKLPTYLKPFHVRLAEYNARRAEIFKEETPSKRQIRSNERIKQFWRSVGNTRRNLLSTIYDKPHDIRPYADVQIFGKRFTGLLDTGASVSCLGADAAKELLNSDISFKKIKSGVRTADGKMQNVSGFISWTQIAC
ncbi:hypothetical protein CVS40_1659 [Lucilia cuprina]|nr:hypothetical protein CVS40_1659 [Lucilia cuprina]